ncbi:hypothetical protein HHK36_021001 [Tetracentron sinense]|uniref:non-specific serine/threonine protein kinase n=1 Tax=Tetracentron sinense TaxID=13715 RepID=A0A835DA91_TETSI|nr:hypothetical protein HHK36_021001 [Tetracentron sinense]
MGAGGLTISAARLIYKKEPRKGPSVPIEEADICVEIPQSTSSSEPNKPVAYSTNSVSSIAVTPKDVKDLLQNHGYDNVDVFTYNEMKLATKNFQPDQILGEGGFGIVYKGVLDENVRLGYKSTQVAIKELNPEGFQGDSEWLAEVNYLGQLSHPNLVKLIGYCCEDEHRLLDYNAKLSDFGLAKDGPMGDETHVSTRVMGTYGYAAPEYMMTDPRIQGEYSVRVVQKVAKLAFLCLSENPKERPTMSQVVELLETFQMMNAENREDTHTLVPSGSSGLTPHDSTNPSTREGQREPANGHRKSEPPSISQDFEPPEKKLASTIIESEKLSLEGVDVISSDQ